MRDILIKFLEMQLKQQQQLTDNLMNFLCGLTGERPPNSTNTASPKMQQWKGSNGDSISTHAPSSVMACEQREHKCRILQFVPRDQLFKLEHKEQQKKTNETANSKGVFLPFSPKNTESKDVSDEGADMNKQKPILRSDGRYQMYVTAGGKRNYVYGRSEEEVKRKRAALARKFAKNPPKPVIKKKPPKKTVIQEEQETDSIVFVDFGLYYIERFKRQSVSAATYKQYVSMMYKYLNCGIPMNKLTIDDVQNMINALPLTSLRDKVFTLLVQILKKAYALDYLKKHMADLIEKGKTAQENLDALRIEDQERLIRNLDLDSTFGKRVMFYLLTGARPAEMKNVVAIKKGYVHIVGTKTAHADRWVRISDAAMQLFEYEPREFFTFDLKRFRQRLQKFVEQNCGIESYITIYTLRHTFATNLYYLKCPDKERAMYMGHTTTKTTNDFYTSLDPTITALDVKNIYGDLYPEY